MMIVFDGERQSYCIRLTGCTDEMSKSCSIRECIGKERYVMNGGYHSRIISHQDKTVGQVLRQITYGDDKVDPEIKIFGEKFLLLNNLSFTI
jgi:hypothetical protein